MLENVNVCDICVFIVNMKSFLLWVLQWLLLMIWPCFTFLPDYSMIAICTLSFLSFILAVTSLLLNEKLDYCHWLETLPLKIFTFFCMLSAVFLHFYFLYFKELSLYAWYSDIIYLLSMKVCATWIVASK